MMTDAQFDAMVALIWLGKDATNWPDRLDKQHPIIATLNAKRDEVRAAISEPVVWDEYRCAVVD